MILTVLGANSNSEEESFIYLSHQEARDVYEDIQIEICTAPLEARNTLKGIFAYCHAFV